MFELISFILVWLTIGLTAQRVVRSIRARYKIHHRPAKEINPRPKLEVHHE